MNTDINLVFLIAGSLGMLIGAYTLNRSRRKQPAAPESARPGQSVPDEVELLRYENAMLRSEQQRSLSLGKAGERVRENLGDKLGDGAAPPTSGTDEGDDAWTALTEATVLRDAILAVCRDVQAAMRNVEVQLSSGVPITELDRRRTDRGSQTPSAGAPSHQGHESPGGHEAITHTRLDLPVAPVGPETGS